ncbi:MAG TPA: hypothetical protein VFS39_12545 [Nitrospira sp.]|nr:hypothetical protein [Nitrospira sp.]
MIRRIHARRHERRTQAWRVFYGSRELAGEGTVLDMHEEGCRIAGCMPVEIGTRLRLCMWPTPNPGGIVIAHGTVRWATGLQFGVALETAKQEETKSHVPAAHPAEQDDRTPADLA